MSAPANTFFALLAIALVLLMQPDDDIRGSADNAVFSRPRRMPVPTDAPTKKYPYSLGLMIQNSALGQSQGDQAWTRAVQGQGRQVIRRGSMPVPRYYNLAEDGVTFVGASSPVFATIAAAEGSLQKQRGIKVSSSKYDLSESTFLSCDVTSMFPFGCDTGLYPRVAYSVLEHIGVSNETDNGPSGGSFGFYCPPAATVYEETRFQFQFMSSDAEVRRFMFEKGPVLAALQVTEDFMFPNSGAISRATNFTYDVGTPSQVVGYHMVACTGFDWNYRSKNTNLTGAWICKNSWGRNWGNGGYFKIAVGQLGIMGGILGDAVGVIVRDDAKQCVRGAQVPNPASMPSGPPGYDSFPATIDACDALRFGHRNLVNGIDGLAKRYYDAALSTPGFGIAPHMECPAGSSYARDNSIEMRTFAFRGLLAFFSGRGVLAPLMSTGCRVRFTNSFRLFTSSRLSCADELPRVSFLRADTTPVGMAPSGTVETAAYCRSAFSVFTLDFDGVLRFQGTVVGSTDVDGFGRLLSLGPSSARRFSLTPTHIQDRANSSSCLLADEGRYLRMGPCSSQAGYVIDNVA